MMDKKSFITLAPGVNLLTLFVSLIRAKRKICLEWLKEGIGICDL
jgi:hypothetical protein